MPPLPTIANCFRVTWNFDGYVGVTPRIVQHYLAPSMDETELATKIDDAIPNALFEPMHPGFTPTTIDVLPLDGVTPTYTRTLETEATMCEIGGEIVPAAAAIISFKTAVRGPRGRGRSYVGPVSESAVSDGVLDQIPRTDLSEAWETFLTNLGGGIDPVYLAVASYAHTEANPVTSITFERTLGTQRRRQNQLR